MESESDRSNKEDGSDSGFDESSGWSYMSQSSFDVSSPARMGWDFSKPSVLSENDVSDTKIKNPVNVVDNDELDEEGAKASEMEMEMMKDRFSKLLLGEDMSGSGKGVCPALTLSNAITNLYATVFGQLWKLEPLQPERKSMWKREMGWFLCVADYIVEMVPSWHKSPGGNRVEVMSSRPRLDLDINLPALRKLDNMLLEILDGFTNPEFWYIDQGIGSPEVGKSVSFRKAMERQEGKWWLPVPRVPPSGLPEGTRNNLSHKLECASQILKAVSAINSSVLADMEVPKSYSETLPKSGRACLGDVIYRYITSEQFSPDCLLDCLNLSSDHAALELANRVESAIYVWIRRLHSKHATKESSTAKSPWEIVKDLVHEGDKRGLLVERAKNLLRSIKQRYSGLSQTALDASKIHGNQDVGKSILESYSRVLESLTFSIMARIEDLLYVDDVNKHKLPSVATLTPPEQAHAPFTLPTSGTNQTAHATLIPSLGEGEKKLFSNGNGDKPVIRGLGPERATVNYITGNEEVKDSGLILDSAGPSLHGTSEWTPSHPRMGRKDSVSSVDSETKPQALDRYYMYSSLR